LKFYLPSGEISKADEAAILTALDLQGAERPVPAAGSPVTEDPECATRYRDRYVAAFGPQALEGMRVGVYQHSTVARDVLVEVLTALGAAPVALARSDRFIPVDTEAVEPELRASLRVWAELYRLDAVVSADGDADRPLVADAWGRILPGDVLGPLTARFLGAR